MLYRANDLCKHVENFNIGAKMTFYEYMQTKTKQTDIIGFIAREMSMDNKLFPSLELKKLSILQWQERILDKVVTGAVEGYVKDGFQTAVREFEAI